MMGAEWSKGGVNKTKQENGCAKPVSQSVAVFPERTCACASGELKTTTHLRKGVRLDLRELVLHVVRVHRLDLLPRRGAEHLDNLDELVDATLAWEQRLAEHELRHDTSRRPDV